MQNSESSATLKPLLHLEMPKPLSHLFYGWRMIAVGSALRILGGGLYYYGFSVFFLPLSQDWD